MNSVVSRRPAPSAYNSKDVVCVSTVHKRKLIVDVASRLWFAQSQ